MYNMIKTVMTNLKYIVKILLYCAFKLINFILRRKCILFCSYSPMNYTMFSSLHDRICNLSNTKVFVTLLNDSTIDQYIALGLDQDHIISYNKARWLLWDAVIVADMAKPNIILKTTYIQIYHGVAAKKVSYVNQIGELISIDYRYHPELRLYDVIFFPNLTDYNNAHKLGVIKQDTSAYIVGMTCLDRLISNCTTEHIHKIRMGLIPSEFVHRKVILYAPTWDDSASFRQIGADIISTLAARNDFVIIKPHPNCLCTDIGNSGLSLKVYLEHVFKDNNYLLVTESPYEVMAISDCMIGDFSSITFEYCVLRKPILLYEGDFTRGKVADIEQYNNLRKCCNVFSNIVDLNIHLNTISSVSAHQLDAIDDLLDKYHSNLGNATDVAFNNLVSLKVIDAK